MRLLMKMDGDWKLMPHKLEADIAVCVVQAERRAGRDALVVEDEWEAARVCCGDPVATVQAACRTEELVGAWFASVLRAYAVSQEKRNLQGI